MSNVRQRLMRALFTGLLPLALASCINDDFKTSTPKGDANITFSLMLPGSSTPSSRAATRALTDIQENNVQTIDVLMFEYDNGSGNGPFVDVIRATGTAISSDDTDGVTSRKKTFSVTMKQGRYDLVFLANARDFIDKQALTGTYKKDALASLEPPLAWSGKWPADNSRPIPMWGDKEGVTINDDTDLTGSNSVSMTRMVARVDVTVNTSKVTDFQLTSVRVYNYNTLGSLVAYNYWDVNYWNPTDPDGARVVVPSVPASSMLTEGPLLYTLSAADQTANQYTREIYLYESESHNGAPHTNANKKDLLQRTCLVIGGVYGTGPAETFYRVDFSTGNGVSQSYQDVLRNFWYTFRIDKVSGSGYDNPDDAYRSEPVNIEANVVMWNDGSMAEIYANDQYMMAVMPGTEFNFGKNADSETAQIKTDYPNGWTVDRITDENGTVLAGTNKWLTTTEPSGTVGDYRPLTINVAQNDGGQPRTGYIYVTAGLIEVKIKVTQDIAPKKQAVFTVISLDPAAGAISGTSSTTVTAKVHTNMGWTLQSSLGHRFTMNEPEAEAAADYTMTLTIPALADLWGPLRSVDVTILNDKGQEALKNTYTQTGYTITPTGVPETVNKNGESVTLTLSGFFPAMNFRAVDGSDNVISNVVTCMATVGTSTVKVSVLPNVTTVDPRSVIFQYEKSPGVWEYIGTASQGKSDLKLPTGGMLATPGMIGIGATSGKLTLRGSKEFANTTVATRADKLGTTEFGDLADETVYVVYFKWNSLIATHPGAGGSDVFDVSDLAWAPPTYNLAALMSSIGTKTASTAWTLVPSHTNAAWQPNSPANELLGYGDPCPYADKGTSANTYKTPSGSSTTWNGATQSTASLIWTTVFFPDNSYVSGRYTKDDWSMFLVAGGYRNATTGALSSNSYGYYWSTAPSSTANGYHLNFSINGVNSSTTSASRGSGYTVRCVKE